MISGSIPNTLPEDMYERILAAAADRPEGRPDIRLDGRGIRAVVDAEGHLLTNALKYHPFLIKPNQEELEGIFGVHLEKQEEVIPYAEMLQREGARNVLVSMGERGAVLVTETGKVLCAGAPGIRVVNTVGAGDSMVAGFLAGYLESDGDYESAFLTGLAAGSASAASTELAARQEMEALRKRIRVHMGSV